MYEAGQQFDVEEQCIELFIPEGREVNLRTVPVDHVEIESVDRDDNTVQVKHIAPDGSNWRTLTLDFDDLEQAQGDWLAARPRNATGADPALA